MAITSFTGLDAWKEGHILVLMVYRISKGFPREEAFGLASQMRRCVVSITSNIAEGFSRQSWKEKLQFYTTALGSITELQNQLETFQTMAQQTIRVSKLVNGLIKKSKSNIT